MQFKCNETYLKIGLFIIVTCIRNAWSSVEPEIFITANLSTDICHFRQVYEETKDLPPPIKFPVLQTSSDRLIKWKKCKKNVQHCKPFHFSPVDDEDMQTTPAPEQMKPVQEDTYETHPCIRECSEDPKTSMVCKYKFAIDYFWSSSWECLDCPSHLSHCSKLNCVHLDGKGRPIITVNHIFPGPTIRVCQGDIIEVKMLNRLHTEGVAIHWHGIHQKLTPWMDGVPGLTQCLIDAGATFVYKFDVPIGGTYFYHSHAGYQRGDGLFGSLIVHKPLKSEIYSSNHKNLYDHDIPGHELFIMDWPDEMGATVALNFDFSTGWNRATGTLVNGKGFPPKYFDDFTWEDPAHSKNKPFAPLHEIHVKHGKSYRIRLTSNAIFNCPFEMSIEKHRMTIIATDGVDIEPVEVSSMVIFSAERYDFVLKADQEVGVYWIKFRGLVDCEHSKNFQLALLTYGGLKSGVLPKHSIKSYEECEPEPGDVLNPLNENRGSGKVTMVDLKTVEDDDPEIITKDKADHQFYISFDFNHIPYFNLGRGRVRGVMNPYLKGGGLQPRRPTEGVYVPQLNYISNHNPQSPPLTQPEILATIHPCNETSNPGDCEKEYCRCFHLLKVKLNSIVEIVLVDRGHLLNVSHPFHLHGHFFRVVAMERLGINTEVDVVKKRDEEGKINRVRQGAPIKDTVPVPDGGYTIIRFRADNPGFWFFHCHLELHVEAGMAFAIQVGELDEMLKAPPNFPKCGDFIL